MKGWVSEEQAEADRALFREPGGIRKSTLWWRIKNFFRWRTF